MDRPLPRHVSCVLFLAVTVIAQDMAPPRPAPQLKKFEAFAGHWEGTGTAVMGPDAPPTKWTSFATFEWVLGNHWLRGDTTVRFEGQPFNMQFREYLGWDSENQRYVQVTINNKGEGSVDTMNFVGADQVVTMKIARNGGDPMTERAWQRLSKDGIEFQITLLGANGASNDPVKGTMKRVAKATPDALEAANGMWGLPTVQAAQESMKKMIRLCGSYDVKGEMKFSPDAPSTKIEGKEEIRSLLSGTVVQTVTNGQPGNYQAHGFFTWDADGKCYSMIVVDNMGMLAQMKAWFGGEKDNQLRAIHSGLHMGMPTASRMVLQLDAAGHPVKVTNHSTCGDSPPSQDFSATYTPSKK